MFIFFWIVCIVATCVIADKKRLSLISFFFLALLTGPVALFLVLIESSISHEKAGTLQDAKNQLENLKGSIFDLQERYKKLESLVATLSKEELAPITKKLQEPKKVEDVSSDIKNKDKDRSSGMEIDFGRYWLNKIGIVIFTLGLGFLISYAFNYFGAVLKIATGYLVSIVLFIFGFKLEAKEKFTRFGRVLLGGGWAVVYITTYAMYHFPASRIISSQMLDLCLLAIVVVGMIAHVLKYKSEEMMSVTLLVAYMTLTLGQITSFTVMGCLVLAALILFFVYRFQWIKTLILGVIATYGIHYIWVMPNIMHSIRQPVFFNMPVADYSLLMDFIFLTAYGLVFLTGIHIARITKDNKLAKVLAAANFGNISLYSVMAYPLILGLFYGQRFSIVLLIGLIYLVLALAMKRIGQRQLYISDIVAAVFMITFSFSLKFLPTQTIMLWLIEAPFLLFIGLHFKEKVFRYLSYALTIFIGLRIFIYSFAYLSDVYFLGLMWSWHEFVSLWACVSTAGCFYLIQQAKESAELNDKDRVFDHIFSLASCFYLTLLLASRVRQPWSTFSLSIEGIFLLAVSIIFVLRRFRVYSYLILGIAAFNFIGEGVVTRLSLLRWLLICGNVASLFFAYFILKYFKNSKKLNLFSENEDATVFYAGIILFVFAVFQHVNSHWISLALGIAGVLVILMGILDLNINERLGGLLLLGLTLARVIFVDLSGLGIIFKIITFIVLGVLFVGVSFVYNRFNVGLNRNELKK